MPTEPIEPIEPTEPTEPAEPAEPAEPTEGTTASPLTSHGELQGTVLSFDPGSRSGSAVLDDGATVTFPGIAFDAGGLRMVRPGQRVRMLVDAGGVRLVTLVTFPDP